jgi:hypothetical protein
MSIVLRKRPAITIPKNEVGRKRPPIGIPKSKRGLIRMEQAVFKTIVEMAYEMDLAEYFYKVLDIFRIIHKKLYWDNRQDDRRIYYPTKKIWGTIYKLFPIKTDKVDKKYKLTYLQSNRFGYSVCIRESLQTGKPGIVEQCCTPDMIKYLMMINYFNFDNIDDDDEIL